MATAIIVVLLVLLAVYSVKSFTKKMANGCCGGGDAPHKEKVADRDPSHYPYHATLKIGGMSCKNSEIRVENALNTLDGVWARVSLRDKAADVRLKRPLSAEQLAAPVCRAGYSVSDVTFSNDGKAA